MITPGYLPTATERVLPRMALNFTTASLDARVTVTRALNTATVFNSSGVITLVNANLPRFDYNPTTPSICQGLLVEDTRTNLFLNSLINGTDLTTQSVTLTAAAYTLSFYGTGSIVISGGHSATVTGAGAFPTRKTYTFTPTAGSSTFTVSGTVQYAQIELGSFPTSFIPTAGTSVQRNADAVVMTGTNFSNWYNAAEGTFVVSFQVPYATSVTRRAISVNSGATANSIQIGISSSNNQAYFEVRDASVVQVTAFGGPTFTSGSAAKAALAYKVNNFVFTGLGGAVTTDTSGSIPTVSQMEIGGQIGVYMNGWVSAINYYPFRLLNAEVQAFSKL